MMEHTTWLTAEQALERGLIDKVMFRDGAAAPLTAGPLFSLPTREQMEKAEKAMKEKPGEPEGHQVARARLDLLRLRGETA